MIHMGELFYKRENILLYAGSDGMSIVSHYPNYVGTAPVSLLKKNSTCASISSSILILPSNNTCHVELNCGPW
jgi:hypothetical protein